MNDGQRYEGNTVEVGWGLIARLQGKKLPIISASSPAYNRAIDDAVTIVKEYLRLA